MHFWARIESRLQAQRGQLLYWVPVLFGIGIGGYFLLRSEPSVPVTILILAGILVATVSAFRKPLPGAPFFGLLCAAIAGFSVATIRAHAVAAPVLERAYFGQIEGRILRVDRSASDALRLTLTEVQLPDLWQNNLPDRVRVSLHADFETLTPRPGQRIRTSGVLYPPSGPVEPFGFDFQRHAWFQKLGGVGYSKTPVVLVKPPQRGITVAGVRHDVSQHIRGALGGEIGGVAAAITTGERGGLSKATLAHLRATNLAHLLAISGLHMGLLVAVVFGSIRFLLCLIPRLALRWPVKKIAALLAIVSAGCYLVISGASVATERAFVMAFVALCAILFDRRALSLRSVAIAALIVLLFRPESLLSPGFQMSFAATTALVWVFSYSRGQNLMQGDRWVRKLGALVVSSAIAGAATAPFAAAHFNIYAVYSLPANLLAVPVMGTVVMPGAVLAACLAPFGHADIGLTVMGWGLAWILEVAGFFAQLPDARLPVPAPAPLVLPLMSIGLLFLLLWQGWQRFAGAGGALVALLLWFDEERPAVLLSENGRLVGVMTQQGRALSKSRGEGFVADVWLENDGDQAPQWAAAQRHDPMTKGVFKAGLDGAVLWHLSGKTGLRSFKGCAPGDIVVVSEAFKQKVACQVFDRTLLKRTGSIAIWQSPSGKRIKTVAQVRGSRLWSPVAQRRSITSN